MLQVGGIVSYILAASYVIVWRHHMSQFGDIICYSLAASYATVVGIIC